MKRALLILALTALALPSALAAPTLQVVGGQTSVELSGDFVDALGALGLTPAPVAPGSLAGGTIAFPIPGGALDLADARGDIFHTGGLTLTDGFVTVGLLNFVIDTTGAPTLTGLVTADSNLVGRIPLFDLMLTSGPEPTGAGALVISGVDVTLTDDGADALNGVFGTTAFVEGFPIGTATVLAQGMMDGGGNDDDEDDDEDSDEEMDEDQSVSPLDRFESRRGGFRSVRR